MFHIEISWLVSSDIEHATVAMLCDLRNYRVRDICEPGKTIGLVRRDDRWRICLQSEQLAEILAISGEILHTIYSLELDTRHLLEGKKILKPSNPTRKFIPLRGYETDESLLANLNMMLAIHDAESKMAKRSLRAYGELQKKFANMVAGVAEAGANLKKTRSDKLSPLVGGKIRDIRLSLERLLQ